MATESGPTDHPVVRRLLERPREFPFFQAVRLLELACPEAARIGGSGPARREAVRLRPSSSMAFQAAEVTKISPPTGEGEGYRLATTVFGLYGTSSPLPAFYSTDILQYELSHAEEVDPVRAFLDIANHRLISLLYRAWSKYRWAFTFRLGAEDAVSLAMLSLLGIGEAALRAVLGVPAQRLLRYAGFITQIPKNARGLAGVISDYFDDVPTDVEECLERWVRIPRADQNRLGVENTTLSESLVVGESVRDRSGKYRFAIGPVEDLPSFQAFLPVGRHFRPLGALIRLLLPDPLEYDLYLGLRGEAVPMLRVTIRAEAAQLGWTSWLRSDRECPDKWEVFPPPPLEEAA